MKRLALQLALAVTAAFTLAVAAPARASDCADCPKHKSAATDPKSGAEKPQKKDAKPAEKAPAAPAAPAATDAKKTTQAPTDCKCEKGGKGCTCPKGECKCANCGAHRVAANDKPAAEKPKCGCGDKDCGCKKNDKGECTCKHATPKAA